MKLKIEVKDLRVGDVLLPTNREVTRAPSKGLFTPKGKVDLCVGAVRVTFGARTLVTINRGVPQVPASLNDWLKQDTKEIA